MATFNRDKAKAAGWSDKQIDDYLSSPQAKADSQNAALRAQTSAAAPTQTGTNPLSEVVGATMQGVGGLKALGIPLGVAAGAFGLKKLFGEKGTGASLVKLTRADIAEHPEFSRFKPGYKMSRTNYESVKMASPLPPPVAAAAEATATPPRDVVTQEMIDRYHIFRGFKPGDTLPAGQLEAAIGASRPNLSLVGAGGPPPMLEATVTPEGMTPPSRHEVQYYSESQGKFVPIEDMHISQLRNAVNKLGRKLASSKKPSPVAEKQFEALKNEITYRAQQAGELTVPSENAGIARSFRPGLGEGIGGLNEVAMILGMLQAPQQMAETDALMNQVRMNEARRQQMSPALFRALYGEQPTGN
jgi:hypothetical protein